MAQSVARILGKDEVGGSSPLGSSEKRSFEAWLFERLFCGSGFENKAASYQSRLPMASSVSMAI